MQKLKVAVIVPNFNGKQLLEKNLPHILIARKRTRNNISQIIVVDDASTDMSVEYVSKNFPDIKLVVHSHNKGFPAAANSGVRTAEADLVVLLNTDVAPTDNFLVPIFSHFADQKVFAVSLHEQGYGWAKGSFVDGFVEHEIGGEGNKPRRTFWVSGGSGVFRRKVWNELGGLDEKLYTPFYWEDVDLSYRALKRGYKLLWEPAAYVTHNHESTIGRQFVKSQTSLIQERNQLLFIWKNITTPSFFKRHVFGLLRRSLKHPGYLKVIIAAIALIKDVKPARAKEIREAIITDRQIFASFHNG